MDRQTSYHGPWGSLDPRAPTPQGPPRGPEAPEDQGNVLTGIIGALLGALVGAVPWFLVSTLANFYVGWLGFLVGWASAFGYQRLKGRKSFGLAMAVVVISSLLALLAAEFGTIMYALCTNSEVQDLANWYGIPVVSMAIDILFQRLPDVFGEILPNLILGLVIGGLGILSAGTYVRQYTDPGMAAQRFQMTRNSLNPLSNFQSTGLALPRQFTVGMGKGRKIAIAVLAVFIFVLVAVMLLLGGALALDGDTESLAAVLVLAVVLCAVMVLVVLTTRKRIDVDGDYLLVKGQTFGAWDIANVSMAQLNGAVKLYGRDGRVLAKFNGAMDNAPLMMQWLKEHNIPLRG